MSRSVFHAAGKVSHAGFKERAAENRERILAEAARLFRQHGLAGVGVDALTDAAGLTHGSLYSQFGSKERLAAEAFSHALKHQFGTHERRRDFRTTTLHGICPRTTGNGAAMAA